MNGHSAVILMVDDNEADVCLVQEALKHSRLSNQLQVVGDGVEAMKYLRHEDPYASRPRPDLILLDMNMPRKDGRAVLEEIRADPALRRLPVIVMTSSRAEEDVIRSYDLGANAYVVKPVDLPELIRAIRLLQEFWLEIVTLP
ncbi:MAG: response regulator [Pseudomonadota bacterium]|nr:response regulator [Pseudomonadota bacterium]